MTDWRKDYLLRCADGVSYLDDMAGWLRREIDKAGLTPIVQVKIEKRQVQRKRAKEQRQLARLTGARNG